jgi:hypothetical protein
VFDNNGVFKTMFSNVGNPQAMCINESQSVLYVPDSNPWNDIDVAGEIKIRLDGTVVGKLCAGRLLKNSARSTPSTAAAKTLSLSVSSLAFGYKNWYSIQPVAAPPRRSAAGRPPAGR